MRVIWFKFGEFSVNARDRLILQSIGEQTVPVNLEKRVFDLLLVFLNEPYHLLEKEYLRKKVWHESFVEDNNLAVAVRILRKSLGDSAKKSQSKYISTVPKVGYRWIAKVEAIEDDLGIKILRTLIDSVYLLRSEDGIARDAMLDQDLRHHLTQLRSELLVEVKQEEDKQGECHARWYITDKGREALAIREHLINQDNREQSERLTEKELEVNDMSAVKRTLGIIASDLCKKKDSRNEKPWFHIRKFILKHHAVLHRYEILATNGTADIIEETNRILKSKGFSMLVPGRLGSQSVGVIRLAAMVAQGAIERVLFFEDPADVEIEHPENYALLRNCDLKGVGLFINEAAYLWAQHDDGNLVTKPRRLKGKLHGKDQKIQETVVLIAHDGEKDRMARLILRHHALLKDFRLLATSGTKSYLDKFQRATLPASERLEISPAGDEKAKGGDVIVADEVLTVFNENAELLNGSGPFYHVLFFIDHRKFWSPTLDTRVLMRVFANPKLRVNLMFNSHMAEEWLRRYIEP